MNPRMVLLGTVSTVLLGTAAMAADPVKVEGGLVKGTVEDGLAVYRGIPFAAPPVGDLRWRAPQPASIWQGVLPADKFAARCMQGGGPGSPGDVICVNSRRDCLRIEPLDEQPD